MAVFDFSVLWERIRPKNVENKITTKSMIQAKADK